MNYWMLFNKDELDIQALTWKGAWDTLSEKKTGYDMHKHDFTYGEKKNTPCNTK